MAKILDPQTYWEHEDFATPYQMGLMPHREYLLDLLQEIGMLSFLDVGCGTAPLYELIKNTALPTADGITSFQRWPFKYKGTDYSRTMIETCKSQFPEGNFEVQDARKLKEEDNSWDAVVIMHTLDHLDDYQSAIKEAARVARKYVCIILWRGFEQNELTHLNDRNMYGKEEGEEPWKDTFLQEFSREALEDAYKEAGLTIEHEKEIGGDYSKYNYLVLLKK